MAFRFESMIIEIHAPHSEVNESILKPIKEKVLSFSHQIRDIVKAEIILRDDTTATPQESKICEIRLTLYGDSLFVHRRSHSFNESACMAVHELEKAVQEQARLNHGLPDQITSTVKV
ncbi:HPF/RaiA family ribosome-associated protein [Longitalea luteola]|uniref:HPF/RaiA family ribosome-associated protein n=1 Tax=Longitalea luteola TaxID=2812563 RepID=UPI001A976E0A|nr:HPF/RaiA family ribosome-associated protein [Longitalea luteola]